MMSTNEKKKKVVSISIATGQIKNIKSTLREELIRADSIYGISGVYFLFNKNFDIVYIGESHDCTARIKQHLDNPDKEFTYFKIYRIFGEKARKREERKLIKKFTPCFNIVHTKINPRKYVKVHERRISIDDLYYTQMAAKSKKVIG